MLKNDFFRFPKVKWLHLTGEVDRCVRCSCQIISGITYQKLLLLTELCKKNKKWTFFGTRFAVTLQMH